MSQKPDMDHKEWRVTKITEILLTCIYTRSKTNKLQRKFSRGKGNLTDGALTGNRANNVSFKFGARMCHGSSNRSLKVRVKVV